MLHGSEPLAHLHCGGPLRKERGSNESLQLSLLLVLRAYDSRNSLQFIKEWKHLIIWFSFWLRVGRQDKRQAIETGEDGNGERKQGPGEGGKENYYWFFLKLQGTLNKASFIGNWTMLLVGVMPRALPWERARLQRYLIYNPPQKPFLSAPAKTPLVLHILCPTMQVSFPHGTNTTCHYTERDIRIGLWLALRPGLGAPCSQVWPDLSAGPGGGWPWRPMGWTWESRWMSGGDPNEQLELHFVSETLKWGHLLIQRQISKKDSLKTQFRAWCPCCSRERSGSFPFLGAAPPSSEIRKKGLQMGSCTLLADLETLPGICMGDAVWCTPLTSE